MTAPSAFRDLLAAYEAGRLPKAAFIAQMFDHHRLLAAYADRLADTAIARIEIRRGEVVAVLANGPSMIIDDTDTRSIPLEMLHWGDFEPVERSILMAMIDDGATFFDVGANMGWYSMLAATERHDVALHAFEPIPATHARLQRHLALNGLDERVTTWPIGLSDTRGQATFYFDPAMTGNASGRDLSGAPGVQQVTVQLTTLDDFTRDHGLQVDVLKCDVEGAELKVLQGGVATLRRDKPALMVEILRKWCKPYGYHPNDILTLLRGLGYEVFVAHAAGRLVPFGEVDDDTVETNYFFLHPDRHAARIAQLVGA
ncbi:MAG: FkbM family methyltransferase [Alphaproteobacteria bacterium]|nr:FkbM family methyltransferase [Alphaproteobacteria bacterium]